MMTSPSPSPRKLRLHLASLMAGALGDSYGLEDPMVEITPSRNLDMGDLACSSAMPLAAVVKRAPREIAAVMAEAVSGVPQVDRVSVDGPGFINLTLSPDYLQAVTGALALRGMEGLMPLTGQGKKALVEFVSSNPTGPLTVGHCRQAVLGDAVSGLLEALGWNVEREYYFNDAGRQMDRLAESLAARYVQLLGGDMEVPDGGYRGSYIGEWAVDLHGEKGDSLSWPEDRETFREYGAARAFQLIEEDLALLGIRFDRYFPESDLIPEGVTSAIEALRARETVYSDPDGSGKLWLRLSEMGRPEDRVIIRDDGTYTYRMPDIAYHLDKFKRDYDLIVDIFGSDHIDTCRDVEAALCVLLGEKTVKERLRTLLHQFVTLLRAGEKVKMSTRAGEFVTLKDLVDEVGSPDVVRYIFLTRRAEAHMDFDLAAASSDSDDNPVFYVQYAFARIAGIFRNVPDPKKFMEAGASALELLAAERERELMRLLETIPLRIHAAAEALEPHRITDMLAEVATAFHGFYQHHRVFDPENAPLTGARLALCAAVRNTLSDMLRIIGVKAPEKM